MLPYVSRLYIGSSIDCCLLSEDVLRIDFMGLPDARMVKPLHMIKYKKVRMRLRKLDETCIQYVSYRNVTYLRELLQQLGLKMRRLSKEPDLMVRVAFSQY